MKQKFPYKRGYRISPRSLLLTALLFSWFIGVNPMLARELTQAGLITISIKKSLLSNVLDQVKDQSGVKILFNVNSVKEIVLEDLNFKNATVEEALKRVLQGTGFSYQLVDGVIVIKEQVQSREPQNIVQINGKVVDDN